MNPSGHHTARPASSPASFGRDQSIVLLRHGYRFWGLLRERRGTEVVQARLLHERATAVYGAAAAEFFYEAEHTERSSALPRPLVGPLFGRGPVHMLDGPAQRHRKAMFNGVLNAEAVSAVCSTVTRLLDERSPRWTGSIDVFDEIAQILFEAGCEWVGLPPSGDRTADRTRDMISMVDGFGAPSPRHLRARAARRRTDAWVTALVEAARRSTPGPGTPFDIVISHRDQDGALLDAHTAAVEIINLVRPLVAVSWLVSGLAQSLHRYPGVRHDVLAGDVAAFDVAQEVRRTFPFVPFLATRATADLTWEGVPIPRGTLLVLDIWGTNHDPRVWTDPDTFAPRRFQRTPVTAYNLVPQGGGSRITGHRCPGEDLTLAVLASLVRPVAEICGTEVIGSDGLRRMPPRPSCLIRVAP